MDAAALARFVAKYQVDEPTGCWLWQGSLDGSGYGMFYLAGRTVRAHRASYEHHLGPIPDERQLDHLCRTRGCVRPDHLEPVTPAENTDRGNGRRGRPRVEKCRNGHAYTPENTLVSGGKRSCRICKRAAFQRWHAKRTA